MALLAALAAALPAEGSTRRVPSEYPTINWAIDASSPGDTVLVAPGVYDQYDTRFYEESGYYETAIVFLKGGVSVISEAGASWTTLRFDATDRPFPNVCFGFGESGTTLIAGFTITGTSKSLWGMGWSFSDRCIVRDCVFRDIGHGQPNEGGLASVNADLEVYDCHFENVIGWAGLYEYSSTLIVEDSDFVNCHPSAARIDRGDYGHATTLVARRCRFVGNGGSGPALGVGYPSVLIENCWFESNGDHGALVVSGGDAEQTIRGSTFVNNYGGRWHYGAVLAAGARTLLESNTFFGNHVDLDFQNGGAAVALLGYVQMFWNNVVAHNSGDQAVSYSGAGPVVTRCNVFWDNPLGNTSGFQPDSTDHEADPLFCNVASNDFHVATDSPCLPGYGDPDCSALIGAWGSGCGVTSAEPGTALTTWGRLKALFR